MKYEIFNDESYFSHITAKPADIKCGWNDAPAFTEGTNEECIQQAIDWCISEGAKEVVFTHFKPMKYSEWRQELNIEFNKDLRTYFNGDVPRYKKVETILYKGA